MPDSPIPPEPGPQLLVSVRNVAEAREAVAGGCRILDIKDPGSGSLGMAPLAEISRIAAWLREQSRPEQPAAEADVVPGTLQSGRPTGPSPACPLSVALGELTEWSASRTVPTLPKEVSLLKLGLAGCGSLADWRTRWNSVREVISAAAAGHPHWVAVCYADWGNSDAPPPRQILGAAAESGCAAVLIDTYRKNGLSLLDCMELSELRDLLQEIRGRGLRSAVAGSLQRQHLELLTDIQPDVIAVRTAACRGQSRLAPVCAENVRQLNRILSEKSVR